MTPTLVVSIYQHCCSIEMSHNYLIFLDALLLPQFTICILITVRANFKYSWMKDVESDSGEKGSGINR